MEIFLIIIISILLWIVSLLFKVRNELVWVNIYLKRNYDKNPNSDLLVGISNHLYAIEGSASNIENEIKLSDEEKKKARKEEKRIIEEIVNACSDEPLDEIEEKKDEYPFQESRDRDMLGVNYNSSKEDIHSAYVKLAKKFNPHESIENRDKFTSIQDAYKRLTKEH